MKVDTKIKIIEKSIDGILGQVNMDVEAKIKTGEITSIQGLYDAFYNKEIQQQMREMYAQ